LPPAIFAFMAFEIVWALPVLPPKSMPARWALGAVPIGFTTSVIAFVIVTQ
jgi:hypothetical protein